MTERADLGQRLRLWADELRAIANEGMHWDSQNPYNVRRFTRVRRIAAELFATQDVRDGDAIEQLFSSDPWHLAPYPWGDAAIFKSGGKILLIQRADDQLWARPGGAFEVGETPAQGACREAWEETGVEVEPLALVGVYDSRLCGTKSRAHLYQVVFLCRPRDPDAQPIVSNETLDVRWYDEAALPALSLGHAQRIADAFRCRRGQQREAIFDIPSERLGGL
jgi:8-oxo-dGTP pyrophosphatase MutT (NUDIX family)